LIWLICFGLFCIGYSRESNENTENNESNKYFIIRYHAFRISFVLTTICVLISSFTFIIKKAPVEINSQYTLLFLVLVFNIVYYVLKISKTN
jgi:hypothetical protein